MTEHNLKARRILVVEDEYLIADDIRDTLIAAGADVLGPVATIEAATSLIESNLAIDAAMLDINLRGATVFDVADALAARNIPFAFATGYDRWAIPDRFSEAPRFEKPIKLRQIVGVLDAMMRSPAK